MLRACRCARSLLVLADLEPIPRATLQAVRREAGPGAPLLLDTLLAQAARCGACANLSVYPTHMLQPVRMKIVRQTLTDLPSMRPYSLSGLGLELVVYGGEVPSKTQSALTCTLLQVGVNTLMCLCIHKRARSMTL